MNPAFVLRADGNARLGIGHVKRCIALARALAERGATAEIVVRPGDLRIVSLIEAAGVPMHLLPEATDLADEAAALDSLSLASDAGIVLDVSHRETLRQASAIPGYFAALAARFRPLIVIDSLRHECLVARFDIPVDLAVIPYVGAEDQDIAAAGARLALGPAFFILDLSYADLNGADRAIAETATRILITAGGGDSAGITLKAFAALARLDRRDLEIRVAIGPAFAGNTVPAIATAARQIGHDVTQLQQPDSLAPHMAWCDLAISASGLTKYELAATGTPAILLSIDQDHSVFNRPFENFGTARHLGAAEDVSETALAAATVELLDDSSGRCAMSAAGRAMLDGRGAERVASRIAAAVEVARDLPDSGPGGRPIEEAIE